jgi:uncharacterized protein (TIGR04255 family)
VTQNAQGLPDFDDPPVAETVLGVEFEPLQGWDVRHFGLFWETIADEFPHFQTKPPLSSTESRGPTLELEHVFVSVLGILGPRLRAWYIDKPESRLLQVQDDRFLQNWRKVRGDETYPHYDQHLRPSFVREWNRFGEFLQKVGIRRPTVKRWEVTYVNHLHRGREWDSFADLGRIVTAWRPGASGVLLRSPEEVRVSCRYAMPEAGAVLDIGVQPVIRDRDQQELIQITLTAKGPVESSEVEPVLRCLDMGRDWVVRGFAEFTTTEMHQLWRKRERQ